MDLIFNDRSIHRQFESVQEFEVAISRVMRIRGLLREVGRHLYCHRMVPHREVMSRLTVFAVVQSMGRDRRRAVMTWFSQQGPFWEDYRLHDEDDWLEHSGEIMTDSAIAEAAYCLLNGVERALVSLDPSKWLRSPLNVLWKDNGDLERAVVSNYWRVGTLRRELPSIPMSVESWEDLAEKVRQHYGNLTFTDYSFSPLRGFPFGKGQAHRIVQLLGVLDEFKSCFDASGRRTRRGHEIYRNFFTGDTAWFSDSSPSEKAHFRVNLEFPHPVNSEDTLVCTWHGKVRSDQLRIHFSWPVRATEPLYVVYVGRKITRK